jgi:hypothetical protein
MDSGDRARFEVENMLAMAQETSRILVLAERNMDDLLGELLAYATSGGTSSSDNIAYEIKSAIRMLTRAKEELRAMMDGPMLQTQSDIATYRNKLS